MLLCGILLWYVYHVCIKRKGLAFYYVYIICRYIFVKRMKINEHTPSSINIPEITMYLNSSASLKHFGLASATAFFDEYFQISISPSVSKLRGMHG